MLSLFDEYAAVYYACNKEEGKIYERYMNE